MAQAHIYLDTRSRKQDGTYPLKIVVSHRGKSVLIPLDMSIRSDCWDSKKRKVTTLPNKNQLNSYLSRRLIQVEDILRDLTLEGRLVGITPARLKALLTSEPEPQEGNFLRHFLSFMDKKSEGTRKTYKVTLQWIERFEDNLENLRFEDITKQWAEGFEKFLTDNGIGTNTRNLYLRNIRAVFNDAIDDDITTNYPFRKIKLKKEETKKRNIAVKDLRQILTATITDHRYKKERQMYLDAFRLMFCLIGINTADLCSLMPENYRDGRIVYRRHKTGRIYDIKVEPEAAEVIEKYRGKRLLLSFAEESSIAVFNVHMNRSLKNFGSHLSTYYARHSWATIAANELDIPKETIARALGHSMKSVTDIYINFDHRKVDEANRKVIDLVLYDKKPTPQNVLEG